MGSVGDFVKVMSMPCREHAGIISRLTTEPGAYSAGMRAGLWLHERYCTGCRGYHRQLRTLGLGVAKWAGEEGEGVSPTGRRAAERCPAEVVRRIRERVGRAA